MGKLTTAPELECLRAAVSVKFAGKFAIATNGMVQNPGFSIVFTDRPVFIP